jgi:hypothetical protein
MDRHRLLLVLVFGAILTEIIVYANDAINATIGL